MRSHPQNSLLPQHLVALFVTFVKSDTKTGKTAITRDYDDGNLSFVFDVFYDTAGSIH